MFLLFRYHSTDRGRVQETRAPRARLLRNPLRLATTDLPLNRRLATVGSPRPQPLSLQPLKTAVRLHGTNRFAPARRTGPPGCGFAPGPSLQRSRQGSEATRAEAGRTHF